MSHIFLAGHRRTKKAQENSVLQQVFGHSLDRVPAFRPQGAQSENARISAIFGGSPRRPRCPATISVGHCQPEEREKHPPGCDKSRRFAISKDARRNSLSLGERAWSLDI